jgi:hypothetical protein
VNDLTVSESVMRYGLVTSGQVASSSRITRRLSSRRLAGLLQPVVMPIARRVTVLL